MRIAYLTQSYPPMISGASFMVRRLAVGLAGRGHQVIVISASDRGQAYSTKSNGLFVERLRSFHNPARADQRFMIWPSSAVSRQLQAFKPDLIHLHEPLALGMCGLMAADKLGVPTTLTLHQLPWFIATYLPSNARLGKATEQLLWKYGRWFTAHCAALIAPSQIVADVIYRNCGYRPDIIGYTVDRSVFRPEPGDREEAAQLRRRFGIQPNRPVILHVGRLDQDKRTDLVVEAAAQVMEVLDAQLLIVGDGTRREALMSRCRQLGIRDRCIFTGFVSSDAGLPGLYRQGDVFVTASEIETLGIVVLESLASAVPVVAANAGAIPELVSDGRNGFLVTPGAPAAMAEKIIQILQQPSLAKAMGAEGVVTALQHNNETFLEKHERLYERCAANHPDVGKTAQRPIRETEPADSRRPAVAQATSRAPEATLLAIAIVLAFLLITWIAREPVLDLMAFIADRPAFEAYIKGYGLWGPGILSALQLFQVTVALVPGHAITISAGYIYGLFAGFAFNLLSVSLAGLIPFHLARWFGRPVVERLAPAKVLDHWDRTASEHGFAFFLTGYLLPVFPADTMNYAAGLSSLPARQFLLANLMGRAPATLLITSVGAYGLELAELPVPRWVWLVGLLVGLALYWGWHTWFRSRRGALRRAQGLPVRQPERGSLP